MLWKYAANLPEHIYDEVWFQKSCFATLLKSHFVMGVLLYIDCIFSEHLLLGTPQEGCFCKTTCAFSKIMSKNTCLRAYAILNSYLNFATLTQFWNITNSKKFSSFPTSSYLFNVNNGNTRTLCQNYWKLKCPSGVFIINFEQILCKCYLSHWSQ